MKVMFTFDGKHYNPFSIRGFTYQNGSRAPYWYDGVHPYKQRLYRKWYDSLPRWKRFWIKQDRYRYCVCCWTKPTVSMVSEAGKVMDQIKCTSNADALALKAIMEKKFDLCLNKFSNVKE